MIANNYFRNAASRLKLELKLINEFFETIYSKDSDD